MCDDEKKAALEKVQAMSGAGLVNFIEESTTKTETAEADFKTFVEGLQKQYEEDSMKTAMSSGVLHFVLQSHTTLPCGVLRLHILRQTCWCHSLFLKDHMNAIETLNWGAQWV